MINEELDHLEKPKGAGYESNEMRDIIKSLESARKKISLENEERWRLKSREIWLSVGDDNTNFFQNYAKGHKNINTI